MAEKKYNKLPKHHGYGWEHKVQEELMESGDGDHRILAKVVVQGEKAGFIPTEEIGIRDMVKLMDVACDVANLVRRILEDDASLTEFLLLDAHDEALKSELSSAIINFIKRGRIFAPAVKGSTLYEWEKAIGYGESKG